MKRKIFQYLQEWKDAKKRKPLIIRGARQVGKSYVVKELGKKFNYFAELNFELLPELVEMFEKNLDPEVLLPKLSTALKCKIEPGKTLLFLDEIQKAPNALISLRYFYEKVPDLHVIAAGSLIDFAIEQVGIPVGRVRSVYMYPLSFSEFLSATENEYLYNYLVEHDLKKKLDTVLHDKLIALLGEYFAVGGMPEAVSVWNETKNFKEVKAVHADIIDTYKQDFQKYSKNGQIKYLESVFKAVPRLAGQKFVYANVDQTVRSRELKAAFELLEKAGVVYSITHTSANGLPLGAQTKHALFKALFLDVALSQTILGADSASWILNPKKAAINKGNIAEAFIGQELLTCADYFSRKQLFYWVREKKGSNAELDYIDTIGGKVVPIEVKSGTVGTLKSMHLFLDNKKESKFGVHFSMRNFSHTETIYSIPLYAAWKMFGE
ncbi:ATP-binding protein [bacterium]|nr:ATP-binding protein [bacterium]